jgi:hypothetical protein
MVRRSILVLLGLSVCLFAAHLSSASPALRLDESRIKLTLGDRQTVVTLELDNRTGRSFPARVRVELLDPKDKVRAEASAEQDVRRGANVVSIPLKLPYAELLEVERKEFPWYRLRYHIAPVAPADAALAVEGVVSISEVTPDLFELRVVSSRRARGGSTLRARVRTANPVGNRPVKGVVIGAQLVFDTGEGPTVLKASATTDGEGFASLDFRLPRNVEDDGEAELKVTARRGVITQEAEAEVSVEQQPRIMLTTDKSLYQPGQTLHMRALVFDPSDHAVAGEEVGFKLEDEDDTMVFKQTLKTSRYGIASADWPIPESARLGSYKLTLEMNDDKYDEDYESSISVKISRYDLPNFKVEVKPDRPFYLAGQNAETEVRGDYLFGQPVKRGHVRVVRQTERRWNYKEQKYDIEEHSPVEGDLDERGRFTARLDLGAEHKELAESGYRRFSDLDFAAYVTDPTTNRTEQRRFSVRLTKDPIHVYVNEGRYQQAKGLPLAFYVSTSYADGTPAECEVAVVEEGATTIVSPPGPPRNEIKQPDRTILKVKTNRYGVAKAIGPQVAREEERGNISLRFVARDREGRAGHYEDDFWLKDDEDHPERAEIRVETDKTLYREGEPVAVELTTSRLRMSLIVDASSDGRVLVSKVVRTGGGRASLVIPYSPEMRGALRITAVSSEAAAEEYEDYINSGSRTVVFPRNRELKLDVRLSQKSFRPGEDADVEFAVRSPEGRRAEGALGVVVFDTAVEERARTEDEFSRSFGYAGSLYGFLYGTNVVAGVSQRDIEQLDLSRPVPDGLEEVAEIIFNSKRAYSEQNFFAGTEFERNQAHVFSALISAQLKPLTNALNNRYALRAEYPADEAALVNLLAVTGVDFAALRDPWGQPYRAQFSFERNLDLLDIYSNGADERAGTDDDFSVARFARPYFRSTGERIDRAAVEYHKRTGRYIRDLATLKEELRRAGLDLDALRDRWGQPYRFEFGVSGSSYTIAARSGGPDKTFSRIVYGSDDFTLWTTLTDYFVERRASIDAALARHLRETASFPRTEEALRSALKKSGVLLDELQDAWGRRPYATFKTDARYADRVRIESRGQYDPNAPKQRTEIKPVSQTIHIAEVRSAGTDGKTGTPDDFTLGYFTSVAAEQSAEDDAPRLVKPITTFSGGTGAITGTVTDPTGAAVPGATVRAIHNFVEVQFQTTTDDEGVYLLRNLPSGLYRLEVELTGFSRATISDVQVKSSNITKADVNLNVAGAMETVEVTASPSPSLDTTTAQTSTKVEHRVILPLQLSTPRLRQFFPETLVWQPALETDRAGRASLSFKLADNITTWKMSVIASTEDGRVGTIEKEFLAFQPFFVEHDPPRILTEGDRISLPVVLRNYLERAQSVEVEMKPESWFALDGPARQRAEVPAGDAVRPTFDLRAVASIKDGPQRVTALASDANDAVEKPVTVHPDGEERSLTDATVFADAGALGVSVPADAIRGSVHSELKIYPNLTAHLLEGVEAIMERPYGCGEQTISSTYPSVLVLGYYERRGGDLDGELPPLIARARRYARIGYERLLGYRAPGGGFSYWGSGDADLALTAYALRFLNDASRVTEVDDAVINETRDWLIRQQREDGSWPARIYWSSAEDARRTSLTTAFIARVLASTPRDEAKPKETSPVSAVGRTTPLQRALRYLAARVEEIDEPYLIASYALAAMDAGEQGGAARAVSKLRALARDEGAGTYWSLETNTPFYGWGLAGRVETTALAVHALNKYCGMRNSDCGIKEDGSNAAPTSPSNPQSAIRNPQSEESAIRNPQLIERGLLFLLRNKDRYGVWHSTQATINVLDTLLGLVADEDAARARQPGNASASKDMAEVFVNGRRAGEIALPAAGTLSAPLSFDLSPFVAMGENRVEVRRTGRAARAQAQVVTTFYVPWKQDAAAQTDGDAKQSAPGAKQSRSSSLRLAVAYDRPSAGINQEVTCSVEAERIGHSGYGMMLAEIGLPPGADVDRASLERAMKESDWGINSYDVLPDRLVVYLWPAGGGTKFNFKFRPRYGLDALTAPSQVYDYYNPEARAVLPPTRFVVR